MGSNNPAALRAALSGDLENFLVASAPGGIEAQEARGQQAFVASEIMPRTYNGDVMGGNSRGVLDYLGFKVLGEADELFYTVQLPDGWKKVATDHSMWSKVLDAKGRERISVFYKAAFYDRSAHFSLNCRYHGKVEPVNGYGEGYRKDDDRVGKVDDQGVVLWVTDRTAARDDFKLQEELGKEVRAYLEEHYPQWHDPFAYWD